jgi:SAM-dependent methyltransferase
MENPIYALGRSDRELERLSAQERLVGPATRQFFRKAGIGVGMRVLDVGSGAGDSAFLAADLVGETGEVIGTDKAAAAVVAATQRAEARGLHNVSFRAGDPTEIAFDQPFDAVVGRYVLLFQADSATMVRTLAGHLRPGVRLSFMSRIGAECDRFRQRRRTIGAASGSSRRSVGPVPIPMQRVISTRHSWVRACRRYRCECRHLSAAVRSVRIGCKQWPTLLASCCP